MHRIEANHQYPFARSDLRVPRRRYYAQLCSLRVLYSTESNNRNSQGKRKIARTFVHECSFNGFNWIQFLPVRRCVGFDATGHTPCRINGIKKTVLFWFITTLISNVATSKLRVPRKSILEAWLTPRRMLMLELLLTCWSDRCWCVVIDCWYELKLIADPSWSWESVRWNWLLIRVDPCWTILQLSVGATSPNLNWNGQYFVWITRKQTTYLSL